VRQVAKKDHGLWNLADYIDDISIVVRAKLKDSGLVLEK
jgi:hypothetical protein